MDRLTPSLFSVLVALALVPALAAGAVSPENDEDVRWYEDAKRGWFWYEEPPPEPKAEEPEERTSPAPSIRIPELSDYTLEELMGMHPDEFEPLLMDFMKKAVQKPTPETITEYLTMQDIARRKSSQFAQVTNYVIQTKPQFDLTRDYPIAAPGRIARVRMQKGEIRSTINAARQDHALLFFHSRTCPYCDEQRGILRYFQDRYGWQIKEVDVDQRPSVAARFGVQTTPAMLLIQRGKEDYIPVAVGVVSVAEMEERLYRGVRLLKGDIAPQEYAVYEFQKGGTYDPGSILQNDPNSYGRATK